MPKETTPAGVTPVDAVLGQFFYAIAHEAGHAMFDLHDLLSELPVEVRKDELVEMRN
jgi:hypothetical protein